VVDAGKAVAEHHDLAVRSVASKRDEALTCYEKVHADGRDNSTGRVKTAA
jgi:hypothetical protein